MSTGRYKMSELYKDIPINEILIDDEEFNCRGKTLMIDVADLIQSIREYGLKQPVIVRKLSGNNNGFNYSLVAGFRRVTAVKCLGRETITAKIEENLSDIDARILNLQENLIRKNLNVLQEAKSIEKLKIAGITMAEIAQKLNVSTGWVQIRFMVLNFSPAIQEEVAKGVINQSQVKALATLPRDKQAEEVKRIKDKRMRGEKGLEIKRPVSQNSRRARTRAEMNRLLDLVYNEVGACFATRILAWAVGNISSTELYQDIDEECKKAGNYGFVIPEED